MKRATAAAHAAASWLLVASVIGAALFAALEIPGPASGWPVVGLAALLVVITGVLAGAGLRRTAAGFGLLLLYFVAAIARAELQPVVTLALFGGAVLYAERSFRLARGPLISTGNLSVSERGK